MLGAMQRMLSFGGDRMWCKKGAYCSRCGRKVRYKYNNRANTINQPGQYSLLLCSILLYKEFGFLFIHCQTLYGQAELVENSPIPIELRTHTQSHCLFNLGTHDGSEKIGRWDQRSPGK